VKPVAAKRWILVASLALWVAQACCEACGSNLWLALAQFESGGNDRAIGTVGEISRYQIRPEIWRRYAAPQANWQHEPDALEVAKKIMSERCARFEKTFHRDPTNREFYILWNAPAQVKRPHRIVAQRAARFCKLVPLPPVP
jgi:hypothetical protein